jgi:rare lipoprotein A
MKKISGFFIVVFLILAAFGTLQAQDNFVADPLGTGAGAYNSGGSGFPQRGIASWYGTEYEGKPTASGELFNPADMTAAHPSLPFGTMLRVTNTLNNREVIVRVNDRGPFINTRILDVSLAAARVLDIINTGTAPVVVDLASAEGVTPPVQPQPIPVQPQPIPIQPQPIPVQPQPIPVQPIPPQPQPIPPQPQPIPPQPQPPTGLGAAVVKPMIPPLGTNKRYRVQVGAFQNTRNAVEAFERVKSLGIEPAYERYNDYYRVVIPGMRAEDIQMLAERLGSLGFREILLREE